MSSCVEYDREVKRLVSDLVIVPDIRESASEYKPFHWVLREIEGRYRR